MSEIASDPFYFKATILPMSMAGNSAEASLSLPFQGSWYFTSLMERKHTEWSAQVSQKKGQLMPPKQHEIFLQSLKAAVQALLHPTSGSAHPLSSSIHLFDTSAVVIVRRW